MSELAEIIRSEILRSGPLPFPRFMELALYEPTHGYYASGKAALGRHGDYLTSVSVGPLFGRLLCAQFEEMWDNLGRPSEFTVVEQGANTGDFAHDVLTAAQDSPPFHQALRYRIIEPFPTNTALQRGRLAEFGERVEWHPSPEALPRFTGVHFSNELLDAMPVHLLAFRKGVWNERYVGLASTEGGEPFQWLENPVSTPLLKACLARLPAIEGYETEVNLAALTWIATVAQRIERGYVLIADYGFSHEDFYHPNRIRGTLTCYQQHRRSENPLINIGNQDITAHVEFTTLVESAKRAGLEPAGFTDQHHFMVGLGKYSFPETGAPLTRERQRQMRAFATLMHPTLMGRGFHFLALARSAPHQLRGFEFARQLID